MGRWYRVSGGEEGPSSGGIVPFTSVTQDEVGAAENSQEEENRRLEDPAKFARSRGSSDQGGVTWELPVSAGMENQSPSGFGVSAFGDW